MSDDQTQADSSKPIAPAGALPLFDEMTDDEFGKLALAASLTTNVNTIALAALLDVEAFFDLALHYHGWLHVPKMTVFEEIKSAVKAIQAVVNGDMGMAQAVRSYHTPRRVLKEAVGFVQSHRAAVKEVNRRISHREAKRRYRANRRLAGFSSRGKALRRS